MIYKRSEIYKVKLHNDKNVTWMSDTDIGTKKNVKNANRMS